MSAVSLDDVFHDITDLSRLIEATYDRLMDMDFGPPGSRNIELDIVASLTKIARDKAEGLVNGLEANHVTIGAGWTVGDS
ncbi:hypothetical protein LJR235_002389 [Pararhizobium sp. LjRoot235]|uniref:hypothetical protein n=1 Tax=Pararhizobium sp. LjRoot235 TaxID=3342291 RepID=UPI003ECFBAB1